MEGAAEDEEQEEDEEVVRKPYLTFLLGNRKFSDPDSHFRSKLHHSVDKTFARSLTTALVYSQHDEFVPYVPYP